MQVSPAEEPKSKKPVKFNRSVFNTIVLIILLIGVSAGGGYAAGYKMGQRDGAKQTVNKITSYLNPLNAISDSPLFPSTVLGEVTSISKSSVTVKMANGKEKKAIVNDQTKFTKADKAIASSEVKTGSDVTVFTTGKNSATTATRIVLR